MAIYIGTAENELTKVCGAASIGPKGDKGDKGDPGDGSVNSVNNIEPDSNGDVSLYTFDRAVTVMPRETEDHALELHSFPLDDTTKRVRIGVTRGSKVFFENMDADEETDPEENRCALTNLREPISPHDAATKNYVDTHSTVQSDWNEADTDAPAYIKNKPAIPDVSGYLPLSGNAGHDMTGALYMGNHQIRGVLTPTVAADAANKWYVDNAISAAIGDIETALSGI